MRDPICSFCRMPSSEVGPLCHLGEHAYNPVMPTLECKRCAAEQVMEMESLRAIADDQELWSEHVAKCGHCAAWRGVIPRGLLLQLCCKEKREQEARSAA